MPRYRRTAPPVGPASLAVGVLGAAVLGGAVAPTATTADRPPTAAAVVAPVPDAVLPPPVSVRPREVITDLGF